MTPGTVPQGQNGGTDLYDAVYLACHDELATEAGRKAVVVLSDAEDTGSKVSLKESIEAAQRSDAVIHFLRLSDEPFYFSMGMSYGGARWPDKWRMKRAGAKWKFEAKKILKALSPSFPKNFARNMCSATIPPTPSSDGTFRKIKVEVSRPDTKILARKGYYAPVQ